MRTNTGRSTKKPSEQDADEQDLPDFDADVEEQQRRGEFGLRQADVT